MSGLPGPAVALKSPRPSQHRLPIPVVAGSGTLIVAFPLLTGQPPAVNLGLGIVASVLILTLMFVLGARRSGIDPAVGGCHHSAALILGNSPSPAPVDGPPDPSPIATRQLPSNNEPELSEQSLAPTNPR